MEEREEQKDPAKSAGELLKLTNSQQKHLFTLYQMQITGVKQIEIAEQLGLSKSAVNRTILELIELDLVTKKSRYEISLSTKGERIAEQLDDQLTAIVQYLMEDMEPTEKAPKNQALDIALGMTDECREILLRKIKRQQERGSTPAGGRLPLHYTMKPGNYEVAFQLLHIKEDRPSMGDAGFVHPCILEVTEDSCTARLALCELKCKSVAGRPLTGKLKYLWYSDGKCWEEAEVTDRECIIPVERLPIKLDSHGTLRSGELYVRVLSDVGYMAMPESSARLKFNFRACKKL